MKHLVASDIMSAPVVTVSPDAKVDEIARAMRQHRISGVCVVDGEDLLMGVVTEGDIVRKELGPGGQPEVSYLDGPPRLGSSARDLMTTELFTAAPTTLVRDVACTMHQQGVNRIPILDAGELVGIVTRADIVGLFDRAPQELASEVRRSLQEDLLLDPEAFEVAVHGGTVSLRGTLDDERDARLIEVFVGQIDGVTEVDTSGLEVVASA